MTGWRSVIGGDTGTRLVLLRSPDCIIKGRGGQELRWCLQPLPHLQPNPPSAIYFCRPAPRRCRLLLFYYSLQIYYFYPLVSLPNPPLPSLTRSFFIFFFCHFLLIPQRSLSVSRAAPPPLTGFNVFMLITTAAATGVIVMMMMTPATTATRHRGSDGHKDTNTVAERSEGSTRNGRGREKGCRGNKQSWSGPAAPPSYPLPCFRSSASFHNNNNTILKS